MTRRTWFQYVVGALGIFALARQPAKAQFTDAQKIAFADMELRGFRDLGFDSTIVQRIVHWHKLGNTVAARAMIEELYKLKTRHSTLTSADRHQISHWVEEHSAGDGRNFQ